MRMLSLVAMLSVVQLGYGINPLIYTHLRVLPSMKVDMIEKLNNELNKELKLPKELQDIKQRQNAMVGFTKGIQKEGKPYWISFKKNTNELIKFDTEKNQIIKFTISDDKISKIDFDPFYQGSWRSGLFICTDSACYTININCVKEGRDEGRLFFINDCPAKDVSFNLSTQEMAFLKNDNTIEIWSRSQRDSPRCKESLTNVNFADVWQYRNKENEKK